MCSRGSSRRATRTGRPLSRGAWVRTEHMSHPMHIVDYMHHACIHATATAVPIRFLSMSPHHMHLTPGSALHRAPGDRSQLLRGRQRRGRLHGHAGRERNAAAGLCSGRQRRDMAPGEGGGMARAPHSSQSLQCPAEVSHGGQRRGLVVAGGGEEWPHPVALPCLSPFRSLPTA